jgi:hypothetical protein
MSPLLGLSDHPPGTRLIGRELLGRAVPPGSAHTRKVGGLFRDCEALQAAISSRYFAIICS